MKKLSVFVTIIMTIVLLAFSAFADYSLGDVTGDGNVNAKDARLVLRYSAKLEKMTDEQKTAADIDSSNTVNAKDARIILRISAKLDSLDNYQKDETMSFHNLTVTKIPYTTGGLKLTDITLTGNNTITYKVTNTNSYSVSKGYIPYKAYNASGYVIENSSLWTTALNPGESCKCSISINSTTDKIILGKANVYKETHTVYKGSYETISGISVNKLPYTYSNGVTITSITFDKYTASVKIKNNSGKTLDSSSSFYYVCYDKDGYVLKTSMIYTKDLRNGESCISTLYLDEGTVKIQICEFDFVAGTKKLYTGSMTEINGIQINSIPYTSNGLKITKVTGDKYNEFYFTVKNTTGKTVDSSSYFNIVCYDADNTVISDSALYLKKMNNGESCITTKYFSSEVKKVYINDAEVDYCDYFGYSGATQEVNGVAVNKTPYTVSGLKINNISIDKNKNMSLIITNNTGNAITNLTYIDYIVYDKDSVIIKDGSCYIQMLNNGETCLENVYLPDEATKVLFYQASVKTDSSVHTYSGAFTTVNGIKVNSLPYSSNGLTITSLNINDNKIEYTVKNNTGKEVSGSSSFICKSYDSNGYVINSGKIYNEKMSAGEQCLVKINISSDVAKIVFYEANV